MSGIEIKCSNCSSDVTEQYCRHCSEHSAFIPHHTVFRREIEKLEGEIKKLSQGYIYTACSGCQESVEGYLSVDLWPVDKMRNIQPGAGCDECDGKGYLLDMNPDDFMDWEENKRITELKEVLKFCADDKSYRSKHGGHIENKNFHSPIGQDCGLRARKALGLK